MGLFAHVQMHTVAKHACTVQYRNMATWAGDIESAHKDYISYLDVYPFLKPGADAYLTACMSYPFSTDRRAETHMCSF